MKPRYVKIGDEKYEINTDFRIALDCDVIARDNEISEYEKILAIIYKLFGDKGLDDSHNYERLFELGHRYLLCDKEPNNYTEEPDMDFEQDKGRIKASFFTDYKIEDVYSRDYMHWWDFMDYMEGLTENCSLNRARYIREFDISQIKDMKEREEWLKRKRSVALKKKIKPISEKQRESANKFVKLAKLK